MTKYLPKPKNYQILPKPKKMTEITQNRNTT